MVDVQSIDIVGVRIRNIKLSGRSIRYSNLPHSRPVSWRFIHKVTQINIIPCIENISGKKLKAARGMHMLTEDAYLKIWSV
jgi:hypothetical protein